MDKTEKQYLIYGGIGLAIVVFALMGLRGSGGTAGTVAPLSSSDLQYAQTMYNEANQFALAKSQMALDSLTAYNTNKTNAELGLAQINSNVQEAQINATSAQQIAGIQSQTSIQTAQLQEAAAIGVAQAEQNASQYIASEQTAASEAQSHTQQQNGLWGSIASIFSSIGSFFSKPTSSGSTSGVNMNGVASTADLVNAYGYGG